jgi:hypothetical protein
MTPDERAALGYAPQLAVIDVLRAAAAATCTALAVAHPHITADYQPLEHHLANTLYAAIVQLDDAIGAYCRRILVAQPDDDVPF